MTDKEHLAFLKHFEIEVFQDVKVPGQPSSPNDVVPIPKAQCIVLVHWGCAVQHTALFLSLSMASTSTATSLAWALGSLLQAGEDSTSIPEDTQNTVWCAAL